MVTSNMSNQPLVPGQLSAWPFHSGSAGKRNRRRSLPGWPAAALANRARRQRPCFVQRRPHELHCQPAQRAVKVRARLFRAVCGETKNLSGRRITRQRKNGRRDAQRLRQVMYKRPTIELSDNSQYHGVRHFGPRARTDQKLDYESARDGPTRTSDSPSPSRMRRRSRRGPTTREVARRRSR